jgi:hypothetical protein
MHHGGSVPPYRAHQVALWSAAACKIRSENPSAKPRDHFVVEHGTPRRAFARLVLELSRKGELNDQSMNDLAQRYWKVAVVTREEDDRLNKVARFTMYDTPEERWAAAGIIFTTVGDVPPEAPSTIAPAPAIS